FLKHKMDIGFVKHKVSQKLILCFKSHCSLFPLLTDNFYGLRHATLSANPNYDSLSFDTVAINSLFPIPYSLFPLLTDNFYGLRHATLSANPNYDSLSFDTVAINRENTY
ncbi:hypothetical protein MEO42_26625, partial [Dolichospermum sp. ST_sed6]|nr:hypothetical protein [Dolichospermum sp. ST_sed6]